jgi:anthranilate phosphoribosyltransferase
MIRDALETLLAGRDLDAAAAEALMERVMSGEVPPAALGALLAALRAKGESVGEITGFARAMRRAAVNVETGVVEAIDTCGTGGDAADTFNISTATALLAAALGVPVAKHGNRAVTSRSGSSDVLAALGVTVDLPPARAAELVGRLGVGFLYAPRHHPAMRHAAPVRAELGVRTVFNVLGPLTNPAGVKRQLLGVYAAPLCRTLAEVLGALGSERAFVVHGEDGGDEVSLCGATHVAELRDGTVREFVFTPEEAGLKRCAPGDLAGGDPAVNAAHVRAALAGTDGARTDAVVLNAAFCAVLAGRADTPAAGVRLARAAVDDGRATAILERLVAASRELAEVST